MTGLILLCIGLVALVGALSSLIYAKVSGTEGSVSLQQENLNRIEVQLHELAQGQLQLQSCLEQLTADVLHREIYQGTDDRHQLAIRAAKDGQSLSQLIQQHGLSSDEAALLLSLHGKKAESSGQIPQLADAL
ncbi:MAG: hypothetical protein AB8B79_14830 [Granulosicoccus sp.]